MLPKTEHIVHQDKWIEEAVKKLQEQNRYELEKSVEHGFGHIKSVVAYMYSLIVVAVLVWLAWWLKNYLKIDLFPNKDFNFIDDSEKLLD